MKKGKRGLRVGSLLFSATVVVLFAVEAGAMVANVQFDDEVVSGGTVSYAGGLAPLIGTDIEFDRILGIDTPDNPNATLNCISCLLNFQTGANTSDGSSGTYKWDGGGFFTIRGGVNGGTNIPTGNTLLTGTWNGPVTGLLIDFGAIFSIIAGFGTDTKHPDLLSFYGLTGTNFGFSSTQISTTTTLTGTTPTSFNATVTNANVVNSAVPIPAALWLFGSAMLGLIGIKRFGVREQQGMALAA